MQGFCGGAKGFQANHIACTNNPEEKRARNNEKKPKTNKFTGVKKLSKNEKEGKQHKKQWKKTTKENKKTEQVMQHAANIPQSPDEKKKWTKREKNCVKR